MGIPNQNSAKLSVSPYFARVRFRSPVFCPFLPIFCPKMGKKWAKTGKFGFVRFCLNLPEFVRFHSSCACADRHPLVRSEGSRSWTLLLWEDSAPGRSCSGLFWIFATPPLIPFFSGSWGSFSPHGGVGLWGCLPGQPGLVAFCPA